ncbi:hypothetical protein PTKIN_Ptkin14bG0016000 [Pterospermum kingtungense]
MRSTVLARDRALTGSEWQHNLGSKLGVLGRKKKREKNFGAGDSGHWSGIGDWGYLADMFPFSKVLGLFSIARIKVKKLHRVSDEILEIFVNENKERRKRMMESRKEEAVEGDLFDVLLKLQEQGDLEDMFGAGSVSSATAIEWAMIELLKLPEVMKRAQNEVRFLDSSVDFRGTNIEYIPFGVGIRIRPGIAFALPSVELPLANLSYRFD